MRVINEITFQQIDAFLTISRHKKLSTAADQMFVTQPALSRTLSRFESNIGVQLFERGPKGVTLTREGEYLYSVLDPLYKIMEQSLGDVSDISSLVRTLRIIEPVSYNDIDDFGILKKLVAKYRQHFPGVELDETLYPFRELRQQLEFGGADLVFSQDYVIEGVQNISYRAISPYRLWVAISANHRVAAADTIDPDLMRDESLLMIPKGLPIDRETGLALTMFREMGFTPKNICFVPNYPTLLNKIRQCKGFSICGRFSNVLPNDIKFYPLPTGGSASRVVVAWRKDRVLSEEAKNFINLLPK